MNDTPLAPRTPTKRVHSGTAAVVKVTGMWDVDKAGVPSI